MTRSGSYGYGPVTGLLRRPEGLANLLLSSSVFDPGRMAHDLRALDTDLWVPKTYATRRYS